MKHAAGSVMRITAVAVLASLATACRASKVETYSIGGPIVLFDGCTDGGAGLPSVVRIETELRGRSGRAIARSAVVNLVPATGRTRHGSYGISVSVDTTSFGLVRAWSRPRVLDANGVEVCEAILCAPMPDNPQLRLFCRESTMGVPPAPEIPVTGNGTFQGIEIECTCLVVTGQ